MLLTQVVRHHHRKPCSGDSSQPLKAHELACSASSIVWYGKTLKLNSMPNHAVPECDRIAMIYHSAHLMAWWDLRQNVLYFF